MFDEKAQQNLLNLCISDNDIFTQVRTIFQPKYFAPQYQKSVAYLLDFASKYNSLPVIEQLNDVARLENPFKKIDGIEGNLNIRQSILDMAEGFCKQRALELAVIECSDRISKGQSTGIDLIIKEAQKVSLNKDFGINFWQNTKEWLSEQFNEQGTISTGWKALDDMLYGGFGWGELEYFIGAPNSGKSLICQNIGLNLSRLGHTVLYFTLEMDMKLVGRRIAGMASGISYRNIKHQLDETANRISFEREQKKPGIFQLINIKIGCTTNDIEAYIQDFELKTNLTPDILIIDYADIMNPCDRRVDVNNKGIFDDEITKDLRALARERTANGKPTLAITASQTTKDAIVEEELNMTNIAGGKGKSTNADNIIANTTSDALREKGEFRLLMLKTRNSGGKGKKLKLKFNVDTLRIEDIDNYDSEKAEIKKDSVQNISSESAMNGLQLLRQKILENQNNQSS